VDQRTSISGRTLRSALEPFSFQTHCIFCGKIASEEVEIKKRLDARNKIISVTTLEFKDTIIKQALLRNDKWGEIVKARVESVPDLVAADAKYHQSCSRDFFLKKGKIQTPFAKPR